MNYRPMLSKNLKNKFQQARYYAPAAPKPADRDALLEKADGLVKGELTLTRRGSVHRFDADRAFDYLDYNPFDNRELHENIQLYSLADLAMLRDAWFLTEKRQYLARAAEMLSSYCRWYGGGARGSVGMIKDYSEGEVFVHPWDNWTLPRRLGFTTDFLTFLQKTDLDTELVVDAMKLILEDERELVRRRDFYGGNAAPQLYGPGADLAAVFWEFRDAQYWLNTMVAGITSVSTDIYPDGSQCDFSTSYNEAYVIWIDELLRRIRTFSSPLKLNLPDEVARRYEKLIDWQLNTRKPNGLDVRFNDNGGGQDPQWYGRLAGEAFNFFGRDDLRWFASGGREGRAPAHTSYPPTSEADNYSGICVMRSGWDRNACFLAVDFGPFGSGHGHPDYGSFILHAYGADFIEDGGCGAYGTDAHASYSVKPWAHSTVAVDGIYQTKESRPPLGKPVPRCWVTSQDFDCAWGTYGFGPVDAKLSGISHSRTIFFAKPDLFIVVDRISGTGSHTVRSKLQFAPDVKVNAAAGQVTATASNGAALMLERVSDSTEPRVVTGQKEPYWDGWVSKTYDRFISPAPALVWESRMGLPVTQITVLYPRPAKSKAELHAELVKNGASDGLLLKVISGQRIREFTIGSSEDGANCSCRTPAY